MEFDISFLNIGMLVPRLGKVSSIVDPAIFDRDGEPHVLIIMKKLYIKEMYMHHKDGSIEKGLCVVFDGSYVKSNCSDFAMCTHFFCGKGRESNEIVYRMFKDYVVLTNDALEATEVSKTFAACVESLCEEIESIELSSANKGK